MHDFLINEVTICDGSGRLPFLGAVAVVGDEISGVYRWDQPLPKARSTVNGMGLMLTPGFIDTHASTGLGFFYPHAADHKLFQGITTEIFGNCGTSHAPIDELLVPTMQHISSNLDFPFNWRSLDEYFDVLEDVGLQFNVATLTGHSTLRAGVLKDWDRISEEEQKRMELSMEESMRHGSMGLSTGLIYAPGCFADTEEIIALAKIAKKHGGIYASHMRDERDKLEDAIEETLTIGKQAEINVLISHLKSAEKRNFGKMGDVLNRLEKYNLSHKQQVKVDVYPYTAVSTKLRAFIPKRFLSGGLEEIKTRLDNPTTIDEVADYIIERGYDLDLMLVISNAHPEWEGKIISKIASENGWNLAETLCEILKRDTEMWIVYYCIDQADIDKAITWKDAMICTDSWSHPINAPKRIGVPHPRSYGAFTEYLYQYVLQRKLLTFEEAVRKVTAMPAAYFGLKNRGRIEEGFKADIVLFDLHKVKPMATYTHPCELSKGVEHLWVNGIQVIADGVINDAMPGSVIRNNFH